MDGVPTGRVFVQQSVRAVVLENHRLLMLYSAADGVYRFPGWSRPENTDPEDLIRTRLLQETGHVVSTIHGVIGDIVEYLTAVDDDYDVYELVSRFHHCSVLSYVPTPSRSADEVRGRRPVWVDVDVALETVEQVIELGSPEPWLRRERLALTYLREEYLHA